MSQQQIRIGIMEIAQAENLRTRLKKREINVQILHNQQTCTSGCKISVEVWAHPKDMGGIVEEFQTERARQLQGLDFDPALLDQVHSQDKEEAICPACGTRFPSTSQECPDCGLAFNALV